MNKIPILLVLLTLTINIHAQNDSLRKELKWSNSEFNAGVSLDPVVYYYGGYDVSFWLSYYYFKVRTNYSLKYPPEFVNDADFKNLSYKNIGLYLDYFPFTSSVRLNGIWFSLGGESSAGLVQNVYSEATGTFNNIFLTGSVGYLWFVYYNFYLNPFFAGHLRIWGDKNINVDNSNYQTQRFLPEISVRIGYQF